MLLRRKGRLEQPWTEGAEMMNIQCPKCDTVVPTDVKLSVHKSSKQPKNGIYLDVDIDSIDYTPWEAHYAAAHA